MMLSDIKNFSESLDRIAGEIDVETRGELVALGLKIAEKVGEPYTYGLPGSDPNVEQLPNGSLRITLIDPIKSGSEVIEFLRMRMPTLGDSKSLKAKESDDETVGEATSALIEKIRLVCVIDGSNRPLSPTEAEKLSEEDGIALGGALRFLRTRFRRTGKTYKTS